MKTNELYISRKAVMLALMHKADTHLNPVKRAYARAAAIVEQIAVEGVEARSSLFLERGSSQ